VSPIRQRDDLDAEVFERRYRELLGGDRGPAPNPYR